MNKIVASFILYRNKFLLVKNAYGRFNGMWGLPNARIQAGQTQEETLIQGIKTTLKLDIWPYKILVPQLVNNST